MIEEFFKTEIKYIKLFSEIYEDDNIIRFWDSNIKDMYTHNFTLIKNDFGSEYVKEIILSELKLRKDSGNDFLRIEFNFNLEANILDELPIKPDVTKYDFMYIKSNDNYELNGNKEAVIKKAVSEQIFNDGIHIDILSNETNMGREFATRRIHRKAETYKKDNKLEFYVCYYNDAPIGSCELMLNDKIAKLEDFDIYEKYQRMGFGTSVIEYLLNEAKQNNSEIMYLITDSDDTAKDMYTKCGFKKTGQKTELFFKL